MPIDNTDLTPIPARIEDLRGNVLFDTAFAGDGLVYTGLGWDRLVNLQGTLSDMEADILTLAAEIAAIGGGGGALDADVVHRTGSLAETITGQKTFADPTKFGPSGTQMRVDSTTIGSGYVGVWFASAAAAPTGANFAFIGNGPQTILNAPSGGSVELRTGNATTLIISDVSTPTVPRATIGYSLTAAAGDTLGCLSIIAFNGSYTPLVLRGESGQTAELLRMKQLSSTGASRNVGYYDAVFATATDASWKGRVVISAGDFGGAHTGKREGLRIESDGTQALISLGGGSLFKGLLSATATLDFPSTAAGGTSDLTISVTGAVVGDRVSVDLLPVFPPAGTKFVARVTGTDTVTLRHYNESAAPVDPAIGVYGVTVRRM